MTGPFGSFFESKEKMKKAFLKSLIGKPVLDAEIISKKMGLE